MKRILLFLLTNLAIVLVLGVTASVLGLNTYLTANGLDLGVLLGFAALMGFGGSFISLWLSKPIAKWTTGAKVIQLPRNETERWLMDTVADLAKKARIRMPEVAIYEGAPNAFATGPSKNNSLVAVSSGLLDSMRRSEVEAVLAHEVAHVANGDMVTLTLVQGVVNTFVFFLARVVAYGIQKTIARDNEAVGGLAYTLTVVVMDLLFGVLAMVIVAYFSRIREYRADAGAASLNGSPEPMIRALERLQKMDSEPLPKQMAASGISGGKTLLSLFSTHPSIQQRIAALRS